MRKSLDLTQDVQNTKVVLNEQITHKTAELTASANSIRKYNASSYFMLSGTAYDGSGNGYSGWYQTVYSGSYLVSSSYPVYDITFGYNSSAVYYSASANWRTEKNRMYKQFAQELLGSSGSIFTVDGTSYNDLYFVTPRRTMYHDKIRPGYTALTSSTAQDLMTISVQANDQKATGSLYTIYGGNVYSLKNDAGSNIGFVAYDAGVIAVSSSFFPEANFSGSTTQRDTIVSGSIDNIMSGALTHLSGVLYQNTTVLHSTIYFCNMGAKEFNYTSNPSAVDSDGRIVITKGSDNGINRDSMTFLTGVMLLDDQGNVLAVAKSSYPLTKTKDVALTIRCRIDF